MTHYIVDKLDIQRGGWVRAARIPADQTNHVVSGLITDHDYNFRVYAENKQGVGEPLDMKASVKCKSPYSMYIVVVIDVDGIAVFNIIWCKYTL